MCQLEREIQVLVDGDAVESILGEKDRPGGGTAAEVWRLERDDEAPQAGALKKRTAKPKRQVERASTRNANPI